MEDQDDRALLVKIAGGDQKAMKQFYEAHANRVYRYALKSLNNPVDASEVMNEVMLEVWKTAGRFEGRSKVSTWLYSITHHKAIDAVRRNSRFDADELDESHEEADCGCSLTDAVERDDNGEYVRECMGELSDGHRQVIYLTFYEGLSYPDISGILGIPDGTVKTRVMHAKKLLQNCLSRLLGSAEPLLGL